MKKKQKNALLKYLDDNEMRIADFARLMEVAPSTIWAYVHTDRRPSRVNALKIQRLTEGRIQIGYFGYKE